MLNKIGLRTGMLFKPDKYGKILVFYYEPEQASYTREIPA